MYIKYSYSNGFPCFHASFPADSCLQLCSVSSFCRYLIVLQIRKDLFDGRLPASFHTLAILGSYTAQGELGDYDRNLHQGIEYLRRYCFAPYQSEELLMTIADLHRSHR